MDVNSKTSRLYIGPAGWYYDDWKNIFYPSVKVDRLVYTAKYFDCIELNSSFYRTPSERLIRSWIERIDKIPSFILTVKAPGRFTHERVLRASETREFVERFAPLAFKGKLGAFLLQFPWSFKNDKFGREYIVKAASVFTEYPVAVELRHGSWNCIDTLNLFSDHGLSFCNIDQPVIGDSIPPTDYVTSSRLAYIRLHGRNRKNWFRKNAGRDARYDFLYSMEDIHKWSERAKNMLEKAEKLFIITNNHFRGQALVNAFQMQSIMEERKVNPPNSLIETYPVLEEVSETSKGQRRLPGLD